MTLERARVPSVQYWQQSDQLIAQHFYIAFCIFMSSIQDMFLGQLARKQGNLNWSATYAYYSMVHGARTALFLTFGDFPTSHSEMSHILRPYSAHGDREKTNFNYNELLFNWLENFVGRGNGIPSRCTRNSSPTKQEYFDTLVNYFRSLGETDIESDFLRFGEIINAAKNLRNDSNYEALLIAHEHNHVSVTSAFESLSASMSKASKNSLDIVGKCFIAYLQKAPELSSRRAEYNEFFFTYLVNRVFIAIRKKLDGDKELIEKLRIFASELQPEPTEVDFTDIEEWVSFYNFPCKGGLMGSFRMNVNRLEYLVEE